MATLSLRVHIADGDVTKTMQFDPSTSIYDTCKIIRDKILEANRGDPKDYGLFLSDDDAKKGVWLEPGRNLEYYILRNGDLLEYKKKMRTLRVQMLDGTLKTMMVDDSQPVANLMVVICTKIGITNHDEYGLVQENTEDEPDRAPNFGTLTLRRKKEERERDAKMDQLRKKLKTDDELNWVDPSKTLREQGIDEGEPVVLRRKFFFSDGNIDAHDPVQLNLLYVQARDAILDGTHPVTEELACQLAGIQVHIQFGNHNESKHKPPFLDLKEFLPHSYAKVKGIEKKIFAEHKKHFGLSEIDAKVLYTKTCRSLPTYGVTFFLVKEKMKGKNKLVPRLLGVTKDSVLRLDERTKEILKTWPLTTVKRWGASPNTFTLDFGDYTDQYYSVQTREAEQISHLISGYIDIILKKQKAKDHFGIEGDEGSTMVEDSVSPSKASILQHESNRIGKVNTESVAKPAVMRAGTDGSKPYGLGHVGTAQYTTISGQITVGHSPVMLQQSQVTNIMTGPQKALLSTITSSQETIKTVEAELLSKAVIPELGYDSASMKWKETTIDTNKQNVSSQIAAMNAATAQIITLTSGEVDYSGVGAAITSITSNLPEMGHGVKMIAALTPSGDELLEAARKLCTAFTELLITVQPQSNATRQNLLNAASRVGEASQYMLTEISEEKDESKDVLLGLSKAVANTTAVLVIKAKSVASTVEQDQQGAVISAATKCALATSQLVACTKVVAATVENPSCRDQLVTAAKEVINAVEDLVSVCGAAVPEENKDLVYDLNKAAAEVTTTLNKLLSHVKTREVETGVEETIFTSSERILTSGNDTAEMLKQARILGQATAQLIQAIKGQAEKETDSEIQRNLLTAAKDLAEATARMVEAARLCASNPSSVQTQSELRQTVEELRSAAKYACSTGKQCQVSTESVSRYNVSKLSQEEQLSFDRKIVSDQVSFTKSYTQLEHELNSAATRLSEASTDVICSVESPAKFATSSKYFSSVLNELVNTGSEMANQTQNAGSKSEVISSLKDVSTVSSNLLHVAKTVSTEPQGTTSKTQLTAAARAVTDSVNNLINVCTSGSPSQKECDNAVRNIHAMKSTLYRPSEPVNNSSYYECLDIVMEKSKSLGDGMTGIANHAKKSEHDEFSSSVRTISDSICGLTEAAAQSAYLIAVSDPTSVAGQPGVVDQAQFARANSIIKQACASLTCPASTQQNVLSAATTIAKYTSSLCNACRVASSKTTNPVAKRQFVQSAKDVANATANLVKEIKQLDTNYTERNREICANSTRVLLNSMDSLMKFASSPEFASKPAHISETAYAAQKPIISASDSIIEASSEMIKTSKLLVINPKDPPTWQLLANHSKRVSDSIKKLVTSVRDGAPGQRECDRVIEDVESQIKELDRISLSAVSQTFPPRKNKNIRGFVEQTEASTSEIFNRLEPLREASKFQAENIGHLVNEMALHFESLVSGTVGAASNILHSKQQMSLLDQAKTVAECILQLVYICKQSGGNPKATGIHPEIDEAIDSTKESLTELTTSLEQYTGIVNTIIQNITRAMHGIPDSHQNGSPSFDSVDSNVDYHTRMVNTAKNIAIITQEITGKSWNESSKYAVDLSHAYSQLTSDCTCRISMDSNPDTSKRLSNSVYDLGSACINVVTVASSPANNNYSYTSKDRIDAAKFVSEKVSQVLSALQACSRGTQACINAASTVTGIIGDLDTIIMFATAGTLHAEKENERFADHRENILKTAKALVEDTKTLVAGAASSQEQLAVAAQNAVSTIIQLAEVVKCGAASLGSNNPESQVMLINAIKDVASALGDLIQATKSASGKGIGDPSMNYLKESAKAMITNVTSLFKTVKVVEDEHSRGTRALESAIEAIGVQEIRALSLPSGQNVKATPEDLIRSTKAITLATAKAVSAGNSCKQEDIIIAANMGRKAISDMLSICKNCSINADNEDLGQRVLQLGKETALQYKELLQAVLNIIRPNETVTDPKQTLAQVSRKIAQYVTELVSVAETLKGNDWVDPNDPTMIAENELLGAAASIDAAAKKLANLRPRRSIQETDETLNFDEMILEAAKSIAAATSALVKAASAAQRELVDTGKVSRTPLTSSDDGQWSEGLISAARLVAVATHSLVESANALVQGIASEEKLISSAKQVASSTAQLLVACKVKADPDSETTKRLQAAGNAVKRATDNLVRAAQQAIQHDEERSLILNKRMVGGIAQEIDARSEVLRIERELEEARNRLTVIRQAKYKPRADGQIEFESDSFDSYAG